MSEFSLKELRLYQGEKEVACIKLEQYGIIIDIHANNSCFLISGLYGPKRGKITRLYNNLLALNVEDGSISTHDWKDVRNKKNFTKYKSRLSKPLTSRP